MTTPVPPIERLHQLLDSRIGAMTGAWVSSASGYELPLADTIGATVEGGRFWDARLTNPDFLLEMKKTSTGSMWFDLVRYAEAHLDPSLASDVVTLVLRYRKGEHPRVSHIAAVEHERLAAALGLDDRSAQDLVALKARVPRSLNAQASLTWTDVTTASSFVVMLVEGA